MVGLGNDNLLEGDTVTSGHGKVRQEGKGSDEGRQDMEHAFLLHLVSGTIPVTSVYEAYNWDTEGHGIESQGGESHDDNDNPGGALSAG